MDEPPTFFDLNAKELNPYWVDPDQKLLIPKNPLHWKAHKLQILLEILNKQAQKNPAQFNSRNYLDTLNVYTLTIEGINKGAMSSEEILDESALAGSGHTETAPPDGEAEPFSMDLGISANDSVSG